MEAETLGEKLSDAQSLVDELADSLSKVETETLSDTLSDAQEMVDTLAALRKYWSTRWLTRKER